MADDLVPINLTVDLYKVKMFLFLSKRAANTIEGVIFFFKFVCVCICVCVCMCVWCICVYAYVHVFVEPEGDTECPLQLLYTSSVSSSYSSAKAAVSKA